MVLGTRFITIFRRLLLWIEKKHTVKSQNTSKSRQWLSNCGKVASFLTEWSRKWELKVREVKRATYDDLVWKRWKILRFLWFRKVDLLKYSLWLNFSVLFQKKELQEVGFGRLTVEGAVQWKKKKFVTWQLGRQSSFFPRPSYMNSPKNNENNEGPILKGMTRRSWLLLYRTFKCSK